MLFLINYRHKIIFSYSPKCACTSLKRWFIKVFDLDINLPPLDSDQRIVHMKLGFGKSVHSCVPPDLDFNSYTKVALVRNPYNRLVSGYMDRNHEPSQEPDALTSGSFEEFVEKIYRNPHLINSCHQQHHALQTFRPEDHHPKIDSMNVVFKTEDLSEWKSYFKDNFPELPEIDFETTHSTTVVDELAPPEPLWGRDMTQYRQLGKPTNHSWFYNDSIKSMVKEIYAPDFKAFESLGIFYKVPSIKQ